MKNSKHLNKDERNMIEKGLMENESFKSMAKEMSKDPSTVSKEVRNHLQFKKSGCYGKPFNDCLYRRGCTVLHVCGKTRCHRLCCFCNTNTCPSFCSEYVKEVCMRLSKPPYACNGCANRRSCTLEKKIYSSGYAQQEYELVRSESRRGLQLDEKEALRLDALISPLVLKGQSLHHICAVKADEIMMSERSLYKYIGTGIFAARNIDMPRVVRMGRRKKRKETFKVDKKCRMGRTYQDYLVFIRDNPGVNVVEMDTVEGIKGGKVLLTVHFTIPQFMFAWIRDANTSQSVIDIFDSLCSVLGPDCFSRLFQVLLGDNGSEFSNPSAIERGTGGNLRTRVFYCDPQSPFQKGAVENNHSLLRRIIPKGTSLDRFSQEDISLMMNHVNSYGRPNLGDKTPYEVFASLYGEDVLRRLGSSLVPREEVTLKPYLLKK